MSLKEFEAKWSKCKLCPLHKTVRNHVLYRATGLPAEVLLVGEAPGKNEDKLGRPFVGRSGDVLDQAIKDVGLESYAIINVVCCIPYKEQPREHKKAVHDELVIRPPSKEEAAACSPHLFEFAQICQPKLIACLGREPEKYVHQEIFPTALLTGLRHPSYILRNGGVRSVEYKRFRDRFSEVLDEAGVSHTNTFERIGI